jgi:hypothetical protein
MRSKRRLFLSEIAAIRPLKRFLARAIVVDQRLKGIYLSDVS